MDAAASNQDIRRDNRRRVLALLREREPIARNEIARLAKLTEAAVSRITRELVDARLIEEIAGNGAASRPGRPVVALRLRTDGAYVVGVNITADNQWVCVGDMRGQLVAKADLGDVDMAKPASVVKGVARQTARLVKSTRIDPQRLLGAGVTIAGTVEPETGVLLQSPNLGWGVTPIARLLESAMSLPIRAEGRSVALLLAETRIGAARHLANAALFLPALGIGGAVMIDGHVARGRTSRAGQIGHLKLLGGDRLCLCGQRGCLDTVASGHAILQQLGMIAPDAGPPKHEIEHAALLEQAVAMAASGDARANAVLRDAGRQLGLSLRAVAAVADPEVIFLAGAVGHAPSYLDGARETFASDDGARILPSTVANDVTAMWLALEAFVYSRELDFDRFRAASLTDD
jgi:predicted NBD/HSP70 family sugar kinase